MTTPLAPRRDRPAWRTVATVLGALAAVCSASASREPDDGKIHVTYWEKWVGPEEKAARAAVAAFNRSQDRIVVEYFVQSPIDRKTLVAVSGGDPPDVAGLWIQNIASFADAEALTPLDDFIRADGTTKEQWLDRYYPVYARMCQHAGHVYAGISTPATIALHWNKTLFREAGLDPERPPRTLAELDEFSRRLTKRDPATGALRQVGFLPQEPGWWPWIFCRWFGGEIFDGQKITLGTDPRNIAAMQWVADFTKFYGKDAVTSFASGFAGQWASAESGFFSGKVAMIFQGVWFQNYVRQYKPGLDYGVAPAWPAAVNGVDDFAMAEADLLVIPRGAKHPAAAWEFIKYLNSQNPRAQRFEELQGMELMCYLQQKNSALREWSPFFEQHHPHPDIQVFRALSASPHAVFVPDLGIWTECEREVLAAFAEVRLLRKTPEQALGEAQARLEKSWDRHRRSLERHGQLPPANATPASP
ncbi:MAG TPA: ABC transporter substrate-binding protein [Opitutaceae bacterium]|nr:ABC transporter substrate-binding protein [Opitutaceae bacterium]